LDVRVLAALTCAFAGAVVWGLVVDRPRQYLVFEMLMALSCLFTFIGRTREERSKKIKHEH
jgi:hypothetical protein